MQDLLISFVSSGIGQALLIAAITGVAARILSPKGKLIWGVSHQHHYRMPNLQTGDTFPVVTQQVWFQNTGRLPIEGIEIVLNWKPQHFEIWDPRSWSYETLPDGRYLLKIPSLNRQEGFSLSMIDTISDLPRILSARWAGGTGKIVNMVPQRQFSFSVNLAVAGLIFAGIIGISYVFLQLVLTYFVTAPPA